MALTETTKIANRYGLDITFHPIGVTGTTDDIVVDYANEVSVEVTGGEPVYATGGQGHKRLIGFGSAIEGNMSISTQVITQQLLKLIAGDSTTSGGALFKSPDEDNQPKYYEVTATTVWKDPDGNVYTETIKVFKSLVRANYSRTYSGDGDPNSIEITVDMLEDETNGLVKFTQA